MFHFPSTTCNSAAYPLQLQPTNTAPHHRIQPQPAVTLLIAQPDVICRSWHRDPWGTMMRLFVFKPVDIKENRDSSWTTHPNATALNNRIRFLQAPVEAMKKGGYINTATQFLGLSGSHRSQTNNPTALQHLSPTHTSGPFPPLAAKTKTNPYLTRPRINHPTTPCSSPAPSCQPSL